jgi:uncharacterized iron-regulated membrane protein
MTHSPLARLRRLWLDVHLWLGVGLMVVLIPLSVSGAILVWHDALDHALYANRYAVSGPEASQPVTAYAAAADRAFAGQAVLTQIRLPQKPGDPVVAVGRINAPPGPGGRPRTFNVWIDPPTAKVLASAEIAKTFTMVTHQLHGSLLMPGAGRRVVGWLGWAMFVSSATGLWLWWPRHAGFVKGLRWHRGGSTLFNLHHMIGFWLCLPLAVLSLTGIYISFPQTSHALFGAPPPTARPNGPGRFAPPVEHPATSLEAAVAAALADKPGAALVSLTTPTRGKDPAWRIQLNAPGQREPATVQVSDASGQIKAARRAGPEAAQRGGEGGPDPLSRWMRRIHDGGEMGIAWRTFITLAGVAPAVLGVTGLVMWLRRRARQRALRPALG